MNDCRLILLLLCCLSLVVGCRTPEQAQSVVQPSVEPTMTLPEEQVTEPSVEEPEKPIEEPPEPILELPEPTPWEPTGHLPWQLTDSEKEKVVEIVLNSPEVSEWLETLQEYRISDICWYALWEGCEPKYCMTFVDEEEIDNPKEHHPIIPNEADFYPGLSIYGDDIRALDIAVDITSETVVYCSGPYSNPPRGLPSSP